MELSAVFQSIVELMEPQEILDTAWNIVSEMDEDTAATVVPDAEFNIHPQLIPLETAPLNFEEPLMTIMHTQEVQTQPVLTLPQGLEQNLVPVGVVNGELVFALPAGTSFAPQSISLSQKRTSESKDQPYVKKPPNAFMLYLKEQRPNVVAELQCKSNAQVNTVLGQRWRSLPSEVQAIYYKEADKLRKLHAQQNPEWTPVQNYGKKRKRIRRKHHTSAEGLSNYSLTAPPLYRLP